MRWNIPPLALLCLFTLGGANAWLLSDIVSDLGPIDPLTSASQEHTGAIPTSGSPPLQQKPLSAYNQVLEHPLFSKTRSPYVPPPPSAPSAAKQPPAITVPDPVLMVAGIMIDDRLKKAYVVKPNEPQGTWVNEGDVVQGWTVQAIHPNGVALKQNQRMIEFALYPTK